MQTAAEHAVATQTSVRRDHHNICLALVWVRGDSSRERCEKVVVELRARPGVEAAVRAPGKANVFMVRFDRGCTSASEIVHDLRRAGLGAVLVGC